MILHSEAVIIGSRLSKPEAGGVILWNVLSIALLRPHAELDPSLLGVIVAPKAKNKF